MSTGGTAPAPLAVFAPAPSGLAWVPVRGRLVTIPVQVPASGDYLILTAAWPLGSDVIAAVDLMPDGQPAIEAALQFGQGTVFLNAGRHILIARPSNPGSNPPTLMFGLGLFLHPKP